MIQIEYRDFSLKIEPRQGATYPVLVLESPAGQGRSTFCLPFAPDAVGPVISELGRAVRGASSVTPGAAGQDISAAGDQLFEALFSGPARSLLERSFGWRDERPGRRGLRIKLHIDPGEPSLAVLANLPWELLYYKYTNEFLSLSKFTPIVRYLNVQHPDNPVPLELPLRVLVVIASPPGYPPLDLERERWLIRDSWAGRGNVEVEFIQRAAIQGLQDRLAEKPYHILHFMGHGDFDPETGRGVLLLEDERGQAQMIDGETLGILLRDAKMGLVFLNACETAQSAQGQGLNPFAGVATAMVMAGIPAVVAMQFPISDAAAITFAQRFYPLLARDYPVDTAVAEGRKAVRAQYAEGFEWATPVLFMRLPQSRVFEVVPAPAAGAEVPQAKRTEIEPPQPVAAVEARAEPAVVSPPPSAKKRPSSTGSKTSSSKAAGRTSTATSARRKKPPVTSSGAAPLLQTVESAPADADAGAVATPAPKAAVHPHLTVKLSAAPGVVDAGGQARWSVLIKNDGDDVLTEVRAVRAGRSLCDPASLARGGQRKCSFTAAYALPGMASETVSVEGLASNGQRILAQAEGSLVVRPLRQPEAPVKPGPPAAARLTADEILGILKRAKLSRLYLEPKIPADRLEQARAACAAPADERILGLVQASMSAQLWQGWFLFGSQAVYYHNPKNVGFGQPGPGRLPYAEFPQREFKAQWWMSRVQLGPEQFFDGRWSEVGVKDIAEILDAIKGQIVANSS